MRMFIIFMSLLYSTLVSAEDCFKALMQDGFRETDQSHYQNVIQDKLDQARSQSSSSGGGMSVGIPGVGNIGVDSSSSSSLSNKLATDRYDRVTSDNIKDVAMSLVSDNVRDMYKACLDHELINIGFRSEISHTQDDASFTLTTTWFSALAEIIPPEVKKPGFHVIGAAQCESDAFPVGSKFKSTIPVSIVCTRTDTGSILAKIPTTKGDVIFNIPPRVLTRECASPPVLTDRLSCFEAFEDRLRNRCGKLPDKIGDAQAHSAWLRCQHLTQWAVDLTVSRVIASSLEHNCEADRRTCIMADQEKLKFEQMRRGTNLGGSF